MVRGVEDCERVALLRVVDKHGASPGGVEVDRHRSAVSVLDINAQPQEPAEVNDFSEEAPVADWTFVAGVAGRERGERREGG